MRIHPPFGSCHNYSGWDGADRRSSSGSPSPQRSSAARPRLASRQSKTAGFRGKLSSRVITRELFASRLRGTPYAVQYLHMTSEFERFSRLVLDAIHEFREEVDERLGKIAYQLGEAGHRLTSIEKELLEIGKRLDILEEQSSSHGGFAKELDDLHTRLTAIERHLGLDERIAA